MIIVKEQKFDDLPAFSKAMALTQQAVAKVARNQISPIYGNPKVEFNVLAGCLIGALRESIHQVSYIKEADKAKKVPDFEIMENAFDKLLDALNKAHDQIEDINKKVINIGN
jgi:hypothetical protein